MMKFISTYVLFMLLALQIFGCGRSYRDELQLCHGIRWRLVRPQHSVIIVGDKTVASGDLQLYVQGIKVIGYARECVLTGQCFVVDLRNKKFSMSDNLSLPENDGVPVLSYSAEAVMGPYGSYRKEFERLLSAAAVK